MGLTKTQISDLQRAGLTTNQISIVDSTIDKAEISKDIASKIVKMLVKDAKFRGDFFEDPLIAIRRSGR